MERLATRQSAVVYAVALGLSCVTLRSRRAQNFIREAHRAPHRISSASERHIAPHTEFHPISHTTMVFLRSVRICIVVCCGRVYCTSHVTTHDDQES